ncbi:MAG: Ribosome-interacting GTPase 1 DRG [Candidatus Methanohalarchaeum thermophilum]|uniref:Ribosome-interacting GTPase 1 DRG n=1 Tax=Methanohalarchaeum thermophilum TaxID=1903181 RepID=A0A1Q6DUY4_METT1|nr:MAG: Ribosome-interacting GTPase 1 DRG [Candidatus Methanohalarchaeum thermophilum]
MNSSLKQKIEDIEKEIRETPYNKSTSKHIGRLKAKLSNLKEKLEEQQSSDSGGEGYAVPKTGDRTVALVGFPSVGKSTLVSAITGADSEVASYDFTTLEVVPGMLKYKGAEIQILDVPGLISGASAGKGRGKEVLSVVRNADLVALVTELGREEEQIKKIREELYETGIRLNQSPPEVRIDEKEKGGLSIVSSVDQDVREETIKSILREYKISNARVILREKITVDRLIDKLSGNRVYLPAITVINKIDKSNDNFNPVDKDKVFISAREGANIDKLKEKIYDKLNIMRVYLKPRNGSFDKEDPMVVKKHATVEDVCEKLHDKFLDDFRYAKIWGESSKFDGQQVGLDHELRDEDILTIIT